MNDEVEFQGSIEVRRWKQGGKWRIVLSMGDDMELELDLEEAAVLTYQLQLALKDIVEMTEK